MITQERYTHSMTSLSVVSGGFDPLHPGHIRLIDDASLYGDVIVFLNSDDWLVRKKGACLMTFEDRKEVLMSMTSVSEVLEIDDTDGSVSNDLQDLRNTHKGDLYFCNGGDRSKGNVPEEESVKGIIFKYGVGGDYKIASSSTYLKDYIKAVTNTNPYVKKWGNYVILYESKNIKVKLLNIAPGQGISFQKHKKRNEFWVYKKGKLQLYYSDMEGEIKSAEDAEKAIRCNWEPGETMRINKNVWHMVGNTGDKVGQILEVQWGSKCSEDDIERLFSWNKRHKYIPTKVVE